MFTSKRRMFLALASMLTALTCTMGCACRQTYPSFDAPSELSKVALPEHVIAPPDILLIDAVTLVPRPPYLIKPLEALYIQVRIPGAKEDKASLVPGQPIDGIYRVEPTEQSTSGLITARSR